MSFFDKINSAYEALQRGKTLARADVWADRATWIGNCVALLSALAALATAFGYGVDISQSDINAMSAGVYAFIAIIIKLVDRMHTASNPNAGH